VVTSIALWQAQVAVAKEQKARHATLPPPQKTRHAIRPITQPTSEDPIAKYSSRLTNGLTDREIGWIVEDFKTAGLDLGVRVATQEEYLAQRRAQDRWYHDALVEAWSLTPEQSTQVKAKLAELFDQAKSDFIQALAGGPQPFKHNGQWFTVTGTEPIHRLLDANLRIQDSVGRYLPSNLCAMNIPADKPRKIDLKITGIPEQDYKSVTFPEPIQIATAEPNMITVDLVLPKPTPQAKAASTTQTAPERDMLTSLRKLHPAQLKILLLIDPDKAKTIETALGITQ
jgi:hypothetical protein